MASFDKLVGLMVFIQMLNSGLAIYCYHCTYNQFTSSNPVLGFILETFSEISNEACQLENDLDKYDIEIRNCPNAGPGKIYKCATISGVISTSWSVFDIHYNTVERDCLEVPLDDPDYVDGRHDSLPSYGPIRNLLEETMATLDLADPTFDGEAVYDSNSIIVSGLQCPKCTWNDVLVDNPVIQFFVDGIDLLSSDSCLLQTGDDVYDIAYMECRPAAHSSEVEVCGEIDGLLTTSVLGVDVEIKTKSRDCTTVPASVAGSAQAQTSYLGCNPSTNTDSVSTILQDTFTDYDLSDANFEGTACYFTNLDDSINEASSITSTSCLVISIALSYLLTFIH